MPSKEELNKKIGAVKTLGIYLFDEEKQCFFTDVEIGLGIVRIEENVYKAQYYFFDGYEIWLEESNYRFEGDEVTAKEKAIISWNDPPELFEDFPIIYTNVSCEIYEP